MVEPLSISAGCAGLLTLGLQVTESLSKLYESHRSRDQRVESTLKRINTTRVIFQSLGETLRARGFHDDERPILKNIESQIAECKEHIVILERKCIKLNVSFGNEGEDGMKDRVKIASRRIAYPFRESTLCKLDESIAEIRACLSLAMHNLQLKDQQQSQDRLCDVQKVSEAIRVHLISAEIRRWLKAPDVTEDHVTICKRRHAGSGTWFIDSPDFMQWLIRPTSFLWVTGRAGSGKSVLCSTAIQRVLRQKGADSQIAVAFFYFTFNHESRQDESAMLKALLMQLSSQISGPPTDLEDLYNSCLGGAPSAEQLVKCLKNCVLKFRETFILLDALDESPRYGSRRQVLQVLQDIRQLSLPTVHILVTSREEQDIRMGLEVPTEQMIDLDTKDKAIDEDIAGYVQDQLETDFELRTKWLSFRDRIHDTLVRRAHGK